MGVVTDFVHAGLTKFTKLVIEAVSLTTLQYVHVSDSRAIGVEPHQSS
jgi:hypothetical protein